MFGVRITMQATEQQPRISPGEYVENLAEPGKIGVPKMFRWFYILIGL